MTLTGLGAAQFAVVIDQVRAPQRSRGRPWALPLDRRIAIACAALRTNLTVRELAAVYAISRSMAHRIVVDMTARLAGSLAATVDLDRRHSWIVDGTLVPTRDHRHAAKSKNYRYSCNAQILVRRSDLHIVAVIAADRETATTRCTIAAPRSNICADCTAESSPMAGIEAYQSL